jgi:plastocyanin
MRAFPQGRGRAKRTAAVVSAAALSTLGLAAFGTTPASAAGLKINQKNLTFNPAVIKVKVGDTLTWTNSETDETTHSAVSDMLGMNSPDIEPGQTFQHKFTEAGSFDVVCRFHPDMFMTVNVAGKNGKVPATTHSGHNMQPGTPAVAGEPDSLIPGVAGLPIAFDPAVGAGPRALNFALNDGQGSWFDTTTDIFGTRSLAVAEMPSLAAVGASLEGASAATTDGQAIVGKGNLTGRDLWSTMNADLPGLTKFAPKNGKKPTVEEMGDPERLLNLDATRKAVRNMLPAGDLRIAKVDALIDGLVAELRTAPAGKPFNLAKSKSGSELTSLLADIRTAGGSLLPVTVNFSVAAPEAAMAHTATALIWPEGAEGMPFDQGGAWIGKRTVQLTHPGLYAFACKVHPYMLGAVVVDDPLTPGVDFGKKLHIKSRNMFVPSNADIVAQLVQKFFVITVPGNWQKFSDTEATTWNPVFPPAPLLTWDSTGSPQLIPVLDQFMKDKFHLPKTLPQAGQTPSTPGVGEVWFDTQMEKYAGKDKSGAATMLNAQTWKIERKIAAPEINMNNPHNMWTDKNEKYLYQTEWFGNKLDVFDRKTGEFIRQIEVGPSPTHVMTRTDTDQMHIALGGGGAVMEVAPGGTKIDRRLPVGSPNEKIAHPHAHWMSGNAKYMAAPNVNLYNATIVDIPTGKWRHEKTGEFPIATGMDSGGTKTYMSDFLGASLSCISNAGPSAKACVADNGQKVHYKKIDLWKNYNPVSGASGDFGGLSIQNAVAPDNSGGIIANTLSSNLTIFDPKTDQITGWLPCDAGCHGVNFGAKKGGGYYAYVTSKFANVLQIVDVDPNADGNPADAAVVGRILTNATSETAVDDQVVDFAGMGGQGVMTVPLAYDGWVQRAPKNAINNQLTTKQRNPLKYAFK